MVTRTNLTFVGHGSESPARESAFGGWRLEVVVWRLMLEAEIGGSSV